MKKMINVESDDNIIKANPSSVDIVINANVIKKGDVIHANTNNIPTATTEQKGIIRIATEKEAINAVSDNTAITPQSLRAVTHYVHEQGEASDTWVINHKLNKKPSITIVDSADNVVEGAEKYIDNDTIEIYFNGAFKGKAYLN